MEQRDAIRAACPNTEELVAYHRHELEPARNAVVAVHLCACGPCQDRLRQLSTQTGSATITQAPPLTATRPMDPAFTPIPSPSGSGATITDEKSAAPAPAEGAGSDPAAPRFGRIGQYELVEVLGHGGMGTVYKARHTKLKRWAAVKLLPTAQLHDPAAVARFQREMEAVGRLDHPNIVQATDAGEAGDVHFLVMEFVEGIDLGKLVRRLGPLPLPEACELVRQAAAGLEHAFQHQLVHRDIKPSNLMLTITGQVKLLDLGLARLHGAHPAEHSLTATGQVMGTADYMAPEQATNTRSVDIRADLYSLGCTLYHLLAGQAPFSSPEYDSYFKKMLAHSQQPVPPVRHGRPEVPQTLVCLLDRLLAKDPGDRFGTPAELIEALQPLAASADLMQLVQQVLPRERAGKRSLPSTDDYRGRAVTEAQTPPPMTTEPLSPARPRQGLLVGAAAAMLVLLALAGARWSDWWSQPAPPVSNDLALLVETMPGLNGQWWFDEAPWLVPMVRAELPRLAVGNERVAYYLGATPEATTGELADRAPTSGIEQPHAADPSLLYRELQALTQSYLGSRPFSEVEHLQALLAFAGGGDESLGEHLEKVAERLDARDSKSAADWHLLAVLRHRLAQWSQAEEAYRAAIAAYETDEHQRGLLALCLADFGLMCFSAGADRQAVGLFQRARELLNAKAPPCFVVDSLCNEANARRRLGDWDEAERCLQQALEIVQKVFRPEHPFLPHLYERLAWLCMDRWRLGAAVGHFRAAREGREQAARLGNETAAPFCFHNRHGIAMAERFLGRVDQARKEYDALLDDLQRALEQRLTEPLRRALQDRLLNSLERRADCDLFQGSPVPAATQYESAWRFGAAEELFTGRFASLGPQLQFKRALALALAGNADDATNALERGDEAAEHLTTGQRQQIEPIQRVARCIVAVTGGRETARVELRRYLAQQYEQNRNSISRDQLEVYLLGARLLLESTESNAAVQNAEIALRLARLPGRRGAGREMLAYLRPLYDAVLLRQTVLANPDVRGSVLLALEARTAMHSYPLPTDGGVIVFCLWETDGMAFVLPASGPGALFRLEFGRDALLAPAGRSLLRLPDALDRALAGTERFAIFWDDPIAGIGPARFPFRLSSAHKLVPLSENGRP